MSLRYIVGKLGGKSPESTIKTLAEHRQSAFNTHLCRIEPEILDMLNKITTLGIRLGLISNTDGSEVLDWQNSPLGRFFEVTLFSHAVGIVKPDPHIYQHTCKNLDVAPSDCIFVGDGNSDELRGAAQVGMLPFCAAWFPPSAHRFAWSGYYKATRRRLSSIASSIRSGESDFLNAAKSSEFHLKEFKEWWHQTDQNRLPRLVSFMFQR